MFQLYFFPFILLLIASVTAYLGPKWLIWVSSISSFAFGFLIGVIIVHPQRNIRLSVITGLLTFVFITGFGQLNRYLQQVGKKRLKKVEEYLLQDPIKFMPNSLEGEKIIKSSLATYYPSLNAIGGYLFLTENLIFFQPNPNYYNLPGFSIKIKEVRRVEINNLFGFIKKRIRIYQANGMKMNFLVEDRLKWINVLERTVNMSRSDRS